METRRIEGKPLAAKIKAQVAAEVQQLNAKGVTVGLAVIMVGDNPASAVYVKGKAKDCEECGFLSWVIHMPAETTQQQLLDKMAELSADPKVNGLLVQLPLPAHIDEKAIINAIPPEKDVDGFTPVNVGNLLIGEPCFLPCTPAGCMELLREAGVELTGKKAVVVGRSNIVGKPAALLLLRENATVTVCHSRTRDLPAVCREADVLIAAIGKAKFIQGDWIKPGAAVIDVGINRDENGKMCGDVDYEAAQGVAGCITPVPGGVGLMTRAMLMVNTLQAAKRQAGL